MFAEFWGFGSVLAGSVVDLILRGQSCLLPRGRLDDPYRQLHQPAGFRYLPPAGVWPLPELALHLLGPVPVDVRQVLAQRPASWRLALRGPVSLDRADDGPRVEHISF